MAIPFLGIKESTNIGDNILFSLVFLSQNNTGNFSSATIHNLNGASLSPRCMKDSGVDKYSLRSAISSYYNWLPSFDLQMSALK